MDRMIRWALLLTIGIMVTGGAIGVVVALAVSIFWGEG